MYTEKIKKCTKLLSTQNDISSRNKSRYYRKKALKTPNMIPLREIMG
jgi:hypothetical protein